VTPTPLLKTASKQWNALRDAWKHMLRDTDEDSVHELRVASRRILSCLFIVDSILLANHRSKARRKIKRLMKKLGPLRDVQVEISIVRSWPRARAPKTFRDYLERKKAVSSRTARAYLTPKRKQAIQRSLRAAERKAKRGLEELRPAIVRARLASALDAQREEFEAARTAAKSPDPRKTHRLRVAAKRLRYSLESVDPKLADNPDAELRRLRRYQKDLGDKRDLSILMDTLQDWRTTHLRKTAGNVSRLAPRRIRSVPA
jgi:CHAD domain-containing protein